MLRRCLDDQRRLDRQIGEIARVGLAPHRTDAHNIFAAAAFAIGFVDCDIDARAALMEVEKPIASRSRNDMRQRRVFLPGLGVMKCLVGKPLRFLIQDLEKAPHLVQICGHLRCPTDAPRMSISATPARTARRR
jgi:hypothetical protein